MRRHRLITIVFSHYNGPLFPSAEVRAYVDDLGKDLGPYTRALAYWHILQVEDALNLVAKRNVSPRQALAFRAVAPFGPALIRRGLRIDRRNATRSHERIRKQIALAEERLARGRYLVGDHFTAADLTFASLMAPVLLVTREEGYGANLPTLDDCAAETRELVSEMRNTRAGKFAIDVFRRHRREVTSES